MDRVVESYLRLEFYYRLLPVCILLTLLTHRVYYRGSTGRTGRDPTSTNNGSGCQRSDHVFAVRLPLRDFHAFTPKKAKIIAERPFVARWQ